MALEIYLLCQEEREKKYLTTSLLICAIILIFSGGCYNYRKAFTCEGKEVRNLLLKNLKGHSAFRTEENKQRWQEARRNEREAARLQAAVEAAGQPEAQLAETVADAVLIEQVNQSFEKGME